MYNLFRYIGLRHLVKKPTRTFLTTLGVSLGVALFTGIAVINESTLTSFKENVESVAGKTSLIVAAGETGFSEDLLEVIEKVPGVLSAVPMIESRGYLVGERGSSETIMILGVDLLREQSVRSYQTEDQEIIDDPLVFLNQPDSIILTHKFAKAHQLKLDSKFELATATGKKTFTVRGLLSATGPAKAYGGGIAIMDIDGARMSFGKEGKLDRVDLLTRPGVDLAALTQILEKKLGQGFHIEQPATQSEGLARMVKSYQMMMTFFSTLALLVGLFLVTNSITIAVAERKREIGTLRALGAHRVGILALFLTEALAMGAVGAFAGAWMGRVLAYLMLGVVSRAMSSQYLTKIEVTQLHFNWHHVLNSVLIGSAAAFFAALWPAFRATQIQPLEAMKNRPADSTGKRSGFHFWSPVVGACLLILTTLAGINGINHLNVFLENLNQMGAVLGCVLVGPAMVIFLVRAVRPVAIKFGGTVTRLAQDNLIRNPKRTASNVMSLMVGLVLVILIASVNSSFRRSIETWFAKTLEADLIVSSNGQLVAYQTQPLHESVGLELAQIPGVRMGKTFGAYGVRFIHQKYEGVNIGIKAFDEPDPSIHYSTLDMLDRPAAEAGRDLYQSEEPVTMVSENFKLHFGKSTGDTVELQTPSGKIAFKVVGVMRDFASDAGVLYLNRAQYKRIFKDPLVNAFGVKVREGFTQEQVRQEIDSRLGQSKNIIVISNAELRKQMDELVDETFANTRAVEAAALFVGLLGLLNTLLISVMERLRELGMLRAIGMSRGQITSMIFQEALFQGGFGAVAAVLLGSWLGYLWTTFSLSHILGWVVDFYFPWGSVFSTILIGLVVALFAGFLPARRAAHLQITEALEYE